MRDRTLPLLVEIGCEEIPARFLDGAREDFGVALMSRLADAALFPSDPLPAQSYSTPRRLVAYIPQVLERQPDKVEQILGPSVRVGFDAEGRPTRAAESFAERNSVRVEDLVRTASPKGEYLAIQKTVRGQPALRLLPGLISEGVAGISFAKSMYWVAKSGPRFIRPIRWILALFGEGKRLRVVPVEIAGVKASDATCGHRAFSKGFIRVRDFDDYAKKLRKAGVEFDSAGRRKRIQEEVKVLLEAKGVRVVEDPWLEDWVVNSTEWPRVTLGSFDSRYLRLPREILVTVMRDHQKYFAVEDLKGNLMPRFVAVLNQDGDPKGLIRSGHERVLAARLTDAEFFWDSDQRVRLRDRGERLARVTHEAELGSYAEKVRRMRVIAAELCQRLEAAGKLTAREAARALDAVDLAKCDLTTQMVQEFTELQGVVGGLYARAQGEPQEVADAVYDHYLPVNVEDRCPRSLIGAVVSLADKLDSVAGGFAVGHEPTGSSDPFALRRQGNAIVKVLVELSLPVSAKPVIELALNTLSVEWRKPRFEVLTAVYGFLGERLRYYLEDVRKLRYDTVRAVLAAGWDVPLDTWQRAEALEQLRGGEDFAALSIAAKRIKNILAKSATADDWGPGEVDTGLVEPGPEQVLYSAYERVWGEAGNLAERGQYREALERIATLRPTVDSFFDKVLVMTEDRAVRQNRLRLLGQLDELFSAIAKFAEIAGEAANVDASTSRALNSGE